MIARYCTKVQLRPLKKRTSLNASMNTKVDSCPARDWQSETAIGLKSVCGCKRSGGASLGDPWREKNDCD
jgi:hypothetical protein